ncbi:amidase family protein [Cordyceps militaris CM01]|uniref:Amidase family protein n=1 Tax=Cordyceps militaris (strain CM01) TaxID=983644 RepID=G3JUD3_CORMM|nr:amidase family protein [Cordyceps militaris CM01]EGX87907.1 amidase family protein [Cordyceps militaris CM01]
MIANRLNWAVALVTLAIGTLWTLPPTNTCLPHSVNLLTATVSDLTAHLSSGRFTSVQLVQECIARIQHHDKNGLRLNSVLSLVSRDQLRSTATRIDSERQKATRLSALFGVPVLVKDNFATEPSLGLPTTGGVVAFANVTAKHDAAAVLQLRRAGAIILGKTNLDELAGFKGDNLGSGWSKLGGKTRSAYTFESPCGSSGGSAVAVSAGFVPVALGSEIAGSITCPASHAALFGFVASRGLVSSHGLLPGSASFDRPGILAKSTVDVASVLGIIAQANVPISDDAVWADFRIGRADPDFFGKIHGTYHEKNGEMEMYRAVSEAMNRMEALGAVVNMNASSSARLIPQAWEEMLRIIRHEMKSNFPEFFVDTSDAVAKSLPELVKYNKEHWSDALQKDGLHFPQGQEVLERSIEESLDDAQYTEIMGKLHALAVTEGIEHAFKTHKVDFLVTPGWSWMSVYSAIAGALMGTVPLGTYPNGRPFGLTFVAPKGQDAKLLQLMQFYEKAFPPRRVPSSMSSIFANLYFTFRNDFPPYDS